MNRRYNILLNTDWLTVGIYVVLVVFGWMNIFATGFGQQFTTVFDLRTNYGVQLLWIFLTFLTIIIIFLLDKKLYHYFSYAFYGITILGLLLVLAFGTEISGAKAWIKIFGFSIQPSEFSKIGVSLALARYLSHHNVKRLTVKNLMLCILIIGVPPILILLQPDPGTAIVFGTFLLVLYREGLSGWIMLLVTLLCALFVMVLIYPVEYLIIGLFLVAVTAHYFIAHNIKASLIALASGIIILTGLYYINLLPGMGYTSLVVVIAALLLTSVLFIVLSLRFQIRHAVAVVLFMIGFCIFPFSVDYVFDNMVKPHQQRRINILLGIENDPRGYGYNVNQSKIAIGSGGFTGKGFLEGTQTKLSFVPEQSTDFIFCTVGEEWGFVGAGLIILLFAGLIIRIAYIAERQRSKFTRIYGYGVASVLLFHFVINISMTIGLFPVIGIPLPFFSYGGSSLLAFSLLLFILLRLDSLRMTYLS